MQAPDPRGPADDLEPRLFVPQVREDLDDDQADRPERAPSLPSGHVVPMRPHGSERHPAGTRVPVSGARLRSEADMVEECLLDAERGDVVTARLSGVRDRLRAWADVMDG